MVLDLWLEMKIGCRDDNLFFFKHAQFYSNKLYTILSRKKINVNQRNTVGIRTNLTLVFI